MHPFRSVRPTLCSLSLALALTAPLALRAQEAPAIPTVRTVTPAKPGAVAAYEIPGRTEPIEQTRVFTRATGIVKDRLVDIGDRVKAGDILAVIDAPEVDRAVEAARATLEQARVRAQNDRALAQRSTALLDSKAVSREDYEKRVSTAAESDAAVRVAEANLARLEEQQRFATVRAPFDAVVAARNIDRGDRVRGDSATAEGWLYRLVRLDTLRFAVNATPDLALRLDGDAKVTLRFPEFPGRTVTPKEIKTSRSFDTASGTMRVELLIENTDLALPAGLSGTAAFSVANRAGTFVVPNNTLLSRSGKNQLAIVKDGKVAFIDVAPGRNLGPTIEVTSAGLAPTTAIIVNPNALLRAGDAVTVATPPVAGGK